MAIDFVAAMPTGNRTTFTFGIDSYPINDLTRITVPEEPELEDQLADALLRSMSGLAQFLPMEAHFYMCQKIENIDHPLNSRREEGNRQFWWVEPPSMPNVFFYTPGKWTIASIAARAFVKELEFRGKLDQTAFSSGMPFPTTIARRACFGQSTCSLSQVGVNAAFLRD